MTESRDYFPMFEELLSEMQKEDVRAVVAVALTKDPDMRYMVADYGCGAYEMKECAGILDMYANEAFINEGKLAEEMEQEEEDETD